MEWLSAIALQTRHQLRQADAGTFLRGWHALLYLYPGLHPDNAIDHGETTEIIDQPLIESLDLSRRYERSGWPVILEPLGREAWRRYEAHQITDEDFYCVEAQRAGFSAPSQKPRFVAALEA
jgi:DNA (cytosine-5)-methyltransferase 1